MTYNLEKQQLQVKLGNGNLVWLRLWNGNFFKVLMINLFTILKPIGKSIGMLFASAFSGIARYTCIMVKLCERQFGLSLR